MVSDGDENAFERERRSLAALYVAQLNGFDGTFAGIQNFFDDGRGDDADFVVGADAILHDFRGAEFIAAMNQVDAAGEFCEEVGLLHGGIAAADNGNLFAAKEKTVAGGAGGDAVAHELLFGIETEQAGRRAGGHDERVRAIAFLRRGDRERAARQIHIGDRAGAKLGAEALRLLAHVLDQFGTEDAVGKTGIIFDHRRERELAAGFVAVNDEWA